MKYNSATSSDKNLLEEVQTWQSKWKIRILERYLMEASKYDYRQQNGSLLNPCQVDTQQKQEIQRRILGTSEMRMLRAAGGVD